MDNSFTFVTSLTPATGKIKGFPKFSKLSNGKMKNKTDRIKTNKFKKKDSFIASENSSLDSSITVYHKILTENIRMDVKKTLTPRLRTKNKLDSYDNGIFTPFINKVEYDSDSSSEKENYGLNTPKIRFKKIKYSSSDDESNYNIKEKSVSLTSILSSDAFSFKSLSSQSEQSFKSSEELPIEKRSDIFDAHVSSSNLKTDQHLLNTKERFLEINKDIVEICATTNNLKLNQFSSSEDVYICKEDEEEASIRRKLLKKIKTAKVRSKKKSLSSSENELINLNENSLKKFDDENNLNEIKKNVVKKPRKVKNLTKLTPTLYNKCKNISSNSTIDSTPVNNLKNLDRANIIADSIKNNFLACTPVRFNLKNVNKLSPNCNKQNEKPLSFLRSLSIFNSPHLLHPEAEKYKKKFKKLKEELTQKLFILFNEQVFENKLPKDLKIEWNARMRSSSGFCYNKRIKTIIGPNNECLRTSRIALSTKIIETPERLRDTLIHELCHAAAWIINNKADGHGPFWKAWVKKALQIFPELPPIKRCHDYSIKTKFQYKCVQCGYTIGRHSKSLNLERKRCGYCYGRFELILNHENLKSHVTVLSPSGNVKPRPLSKFALFVKENYGKIKSDNIKLKHGEIMKILSKNFKEIRI